MYVCKTHSKHIKEIHKQIVLKAFESRYKIRCFILTNIWQLIVAILCEMDAITSARASPPKCL